MNKVFLIGRLTRDPELRYTESNVPVASFTLAINRNHTNQDGEREADFINIIAWKKQAENIKNYIKKGSQIAVDGRIQTRSYEKDGQKHYVTEVVVDSIQFLESKQETTKDANQEDPFSEMGKKVEVEDYFKVDENDLPF